MGMNIKIQAAINRRHVSGEVLLSNGWQCKKNLSYVKEYEKDVEGHPFVIAIYPDCENGTRTNIFWQKDNDFHLDLWKPYFCIGDLNTIFSMYNINEHIRHE